MTRTLLALVVAAVLLAGCAGTGDGASPTPADSTAGASPVDGVVIAVDAASLNDVRGFTLRTAGGETIDFVIGVLEDPTAFPPAHLAEHQATSSPVRAWFRVEAGRRVVYGLADAPG